ncbi:MAG: hypothetical protein CSA35_02555 [Dethiosulfovibrio peptidovorans]|nr:MAG: hypothetical protein CSA35_02555 [Dethiosulfovibrio peptidovorans]
MTQSKLVFLAVLTLALLQSPQARSHELGQKLFDEFLRKTHPQEAEMILDGEPEESGRVRHIYLDLRDAEIGGVIVDQIVIEGLDVLFTPPDTWNTESADVLSALSTNALTVIREQDINDHLKQKEFGKDERWDNIQLDFSPGRVYARGNYLANALFIKLNILIEIDGTFKVTGGKQIWLDDYTLKVNRATIPDGLTDRAISKIQPILDLRKFIFPVQLEKVILTDEAALIESIRRPHPFEGIRYKYKAPLAHL